MLRLDFNFLLHVSLKMKSTSTLWGLLFLFFENSVSDRLIQWDQSHLPLAKASSKVGAKLYMDLHTEIGIRINRTWDLESSTLQDPKPTTRPKPIKSILIKGIINLSLVSMFLLNETFHFFWQMTRVSTHLK